MQNDWVTVQEVKTQLVPQNFWSIDYVSAVTASSIHHDLRRQRKLMSEYALVWGRREPTSHLRLRFRIKWVYPRLIASYNPSKKCFRLPYWQGAAVPPAVVWSSVRTSATTLQQSSFSQDGLSVTYGRSFVLSAHQETPLIHYQISDTCHDFLVSCTGRSSRSYRVSDICTAIRKCSHPTPESLVW